MAVVRVLLIEDEEAYAGVVQAELAGSDVRLRRAPSLHAAARLLADEDFDAVLLDLNLPDSRGLDTVAAVRQLAPDLPVVVLTAGGDEQMAVRAVQLGADDYLFKHEADGRALIRAVRYAVERSGLHRSIQESEARFRAMVEHGLDAITLVDASGRILFDSRSIPRVMGFLPEERLGHHFAEYIHPEDLPVIQETFAACLERPSETVTAEYRFLHKDGSWRWGEATAVNQLSSPAVRAIVVNHRDVSERKVIEQQLRRSEGELRQAQKMEAVGRLAGGIAHDFNNVLTAIFGYTDLLIAQFGLGDPRLNDVLEIRRSAERAAALTRQLLAFSRKQLMQPRTLDLNAVVGNIEGLLKRLVREDVDVVTSFDPDLWMVWADPGQIEQVLMNLAANARDAMPTGGRLEIRTANVHLDEEPQNRPGLRADDYVVLSVRDWGTGIPEEVREHIFEPFFTTKEPGKGTGLGLATVYGIVKQSGGAVYADSEAGQGTTFIVFLPRMRETQKGAAARPSVFP